MLLMVWTTIPSPDFGFNSKIKRGVPFIHEPFIVHKNIRFYIELGCNDSIKNFLILVCVRVYVCSHMRVYVCRLKANVKHLPLLPSILLFLRHISPWTWSLTFCLNWLESPGVLLTLPPVLGLQTYTVHPAICTLYYKVLLLLFLIFRQGFSVAADDKRVPLFVLAALLA